MGNVSHICCLFLISFNVQAEKRCRSLYDLRKRGQDMRKRRRSRNYRSFRNPRRNKGNLNFTPVIVILCLSVGCGYATAKYVVDPVVNYVPTLTAEEETGEATQSATADAEASKQNVTESEAATKAEETTKSEKTDVVEDDVKVAQTGEIAGYALQFGCYSGEAVAEAAMKDIDVTGLQVLEQDNMYKIVGKTYDTKEKAAAALKELPDTVSAFVTTIYK